MGAKLCYATIKADNHSWGHMMVYSAKVDADPEAARQQIVPRLAGALAEANGLGVYQPGCCRLDVGWAVAYAQIALGEGQASIDFLTDCVERAEQLLVEHWGEVEDVADELLSHRRLTGKHISRIIERRQALDQLSKQMRERLEEQT